MLSRPEIDTPEPLSSHTPLYFSAKPQTKADMTRQAASRLLYISHWKLNSESARDDPRLRKMLGHFSVHDQAQAYTQRQARPALVQVQSNELSSYLQHVPSFREFQAALEVQIATLVQITAATAKLNLVGTSNREIEDDSDCDSCDDDWSDGDTTADSDDSLTDNDSSSAESECSSPTSCSSEVGHDKEEDLDLWALRPLTPFIREQAVLS